MYSFVKFLFNKVRKAMFKQMPSVTSIRRGKQFIIQQSYHIGIGHRLILKASLSIQELKKPDWCIPNFNY